MKGLIIDEPWIGMILRGEKTWEMRKTACHYRGPIALIRKGSGHVVGTAEIVGSLPPIEGAKEYAKGEPWHRIPVGRQPSAFQDGWRTPWVLRDAKPLHKPVAYNHPNGAVIWVVLDDTVRMAVAQRSGRSFGALDLDEGSGLADTEVQCGVARLRQNREATIRSNPGGTLQAVVRRGRAAGTVLYPHLHADGCYVVSPSRFEKDYIRVRSLDEVRNYLTRGYSLRMSNNQEAGHRAPSLITSASITGWR